MVKISAVHAVRIAAGAACQSNEILNDFNYPYLRSHERHQCYTTLLNCRTTDLCQGLASAARSVRLHRLARADLQEE